MCQFLYGSGVPELILMVEGHALVADFPVERRQHRTLIRLLRIALTDLLLNAEFALEKCLYIGFS